MRVELTKDGLVLIAQCAEDEAQLTGMAQAGEVRLQVRQRTEPVKQFGYKAKRGRLLLASNVAAWQLVPLGKQHGTGDARKRRMT